MIVVITGVAGFIGANLASTLLDNDHTVIGIDKVDFWDSERLYRHRLAGLNYYQKFYYHAIDVSDTAALISVFQHYPNVTHVCHLAAEAGVTQSFSEPKTYLETNVWGQISVMQAARVFRHLHHFVYASSSSVHSGHDIPASPYGMTKLAQENFADFYANYFRMPTTGLRYFTVYGEWGRPDMAYSIFAHKIKAGQPVVLHGYGAVERDFTHISDIVRGTWLALERGGFGLPTPENRYHFAYDMGYGQRRKVGELVAAIGYELGLEPECVLRPLPPGLPTTTECDLTEAKTRLNYRPKIDLETGISEFIQWHNIYFGYVG